MKKVDIALIAFPRSLVSNWSKIIVNGWLQEILTENF